MDRNIDEMVAMMLGARKQGEPIPVLSQHFPELNKETAYAVQKAVIEAGLADDDIAGYKMDASSDEQQKSMGLNEPTAGVLLSSGKRTGSPVISISDFKLPLIETEIALVIGEVISEPLNVFPHLDSVFYVQAKANQQKLRISNLENRTTKPKEVSDPWYFFEEEDRYSLS